jgi:Ca2+-binding RTX toxin-like protein
VSPSVHGSPDAQAPNGNGGGCTHNGVDISPTPGGGAGCHAQAPTAPGGDCWAVTIGVPNANTVFGVSLIEINDVNAGGSDAEGATFGTGDCQGSVASGRIATGDDCQLDKVYVTTTAAGEAPPPPPGGGPPPPTGPPPQNGPTGGCTKVNGTPGDDKLRGTPGCDVLKGKGGDDVLRGRGGDDRLVGGGGFDTGKGGPGNDRCSANTEIQKSC